MENKIYNFLYKNFSSDLDESIPKLNYQLLIMSLRSLLPYEQRIGCEFNIQRYNREIMMLKSYINGRDSVIDNMLINRRPCTAYDELLLYKIIPIIIANTSWTQALNESLKCIIFYTYSRKSILDTIVISSLIFDYFDNISLTEDKAYENIKTRLIEFSIKKFYGDYLNVEIKNNYVINFEKDRIQYLLKNSYKEMFENEEFKDIAEYVVKSIEVEKCVNADSGDNKVSLENMEILKNISTYLCRLRKGILDPSKLKSDLSSDIDIKKYLNNKNFIHPVFGRCTVIGHRENEYVLKTKTGLVRIKI